MKKLTLISCILFGISLIYGQTNEQEVSDLSSRLNIYTLSADFAQLEGNSRYIQIGFQGSLNDINEMVGYIDRYLMDGNDMITSVEQGVNQSSTSFYKFYLNPLYDANNFQWMLEMMGFVKFNYDSHVLLMKDFSNTVYGSIKNVKNQSGK